MKHIQFPLYDRVIVQRLDNEPASKLIVKELLKDKPMRAKVIAVGKGRLHDNGTLTPLLVKAGDTVLIGKYAGAVYEEVGADFKTTEYVIVREDDILTIFEKEKK
jgi:chaperonin GroES